MRTHALAALTLTALLGCGTTSIPADTTAPTITSRTPGPDATNVNVRDAITVTFSEALKAGTLTDASVTLTSGDDANVARTFSLSADGRTLTVTPTSTVVTPATLTLTLTGAVTDLAGNPLASTSWNWTLPEWLDLGTLSAFDGDTDADSPALSVDGSGHLVVAWDEYDTQDIPRVLVRRWNGAGWEVLGGELGAGAGDAYNPSLDLRGDGSPVVAFQAWDGSTNNVHVRQWNGTTWESIGGPVNEGISVITSVNPVLRLDASGQPIVAWRGNDGTSVNMYVHRWDGSRWAAVGAALSANTTAGTHTMSSSLALDGDGNPIVAWHEKDDTADNVHVWTWTGTAWAPLGGGMRVQAGTPGAQYPTMVVDGTGFPVVAWYEPDGDVYNVHVRRWTGSAWENLGEPLSGSHATGSHANPPVLAVTADGELHVAWREHDGTGINTYVRRFDGLKWAPVGQFPAINAANDSAGRPALALDGNRTPIVGQTESNGTVRSVYVQRLNR